MGSFSSEGYFGFPGFQIDSPLTNNHLVFALPGARRLGLKQGPEFQTRPGTTAQFNLRDVALDMFNCDCIWAMFYNYCPH